MRFKVEQETVYVFDGPRLAALIDSLGVSQAKFGKRCGFGASRLNHLTRKNPTRVREDVGKRIIRAVEHFGGSIECAT